MVTVPMISDVQDVRDYENKMQEETNEKVRLVLGISNVPFSL